MSGHVCGRIAVGLLLLTRIDALSFQPSRVTKAQGRAAATSTQKVFRVTIKSSGGTLTPPTKSKFEDSQSAQQQPMTGRVRTTQLGNSAGTTAKAGPAATSTTTPSSYGRQVANSVLAPAYIAPEPTVESPTAPPSEEDITSNNPYAATYWYDPRIHNWGNIGLRGRFHAFFAPLATAIIDRTSYKLPSGGFLDVRKKVLATIPRDATVLDLACGTGFSTAPGATGLDTSNEMLDMARCRRPDCKFVQGNAESYGDEDEYDIVSIMFATHEMPAFGRRRVLRNAMRVAKKEVVLVDIDPNFEETLAKKPLKGATFLSGEPYVLDYLRRIDDDVKACAPVRFALKGGTWTATREVLLAGHAVAWRLTRSGA